MTRYIAFMVVFAILSVPTLAGAHGEAKPGPHQGYVRMPGGFHTELVPDGARSVRVFLIDIEFKNPVTKDSTVLASLTNDGKAAVNATCTIKKDFFQCGFPKDTDLKSGTIVLTTTRSGVQAGLAVYPLPLSYAGMGHM